MGKKNFYCVARGEVVGIYTEWSKCETQVYRYPHAVHKGFESVDEAVGFMLAGGTFQHCSDIPIFDETVTVKHPKDFYQQCPNVNGCTSDSLQLSNSDTYNDIEELDTTFIAPTVDDTHIVTPIYTEAQLNSQTEPKLLDTTSTMMQHVDQNKIHVQIDNENPTTKSAPESLKSKSTDTITNAKNPKDSHTECTQECGKAPDSDMLHCSKCKKWTHYICTKLPVYQLFLLISTSRKFTCEMCTTVPSDFIEKWQIATPTVSNKPHNYAPCDDSKTQELIARLENCIVTAITDTHNYGKDETISMLKDELVHQKSITDKALELKPKLDYIVEKVSSSSESILVAQQETFNKMEKQMKRLGQQIDEISALNQKVNENLIQVSKVNDAVSLSMESTS